MKTFKNFLTAAMLLLAFSLLLPNQAEAGRRKKTVWKTISINMGNVTGSDAYMALNGIGGPGGRPYVEVNNPDDKKTKVELTNTQNRSYGSNQKAFQAWLDVMEGEKKYINFHYLTYYIERSNTKGHPSFLGKIINAIFPGLCGKGGVKTMIRYSYTAKIYLDASGAANLHYEGGSIVSKVKFQNNQFDKVHFIGDFGSLNEGDFRPTLRIRGLVVRLGKPDIESSYVPNDVNQIVQYRPILDPDDMPPSEGFTSPLSVLHLRN